ncbi:phosphatidate cytidylyltransferase [Desulfonatronovibrio hydrogenovorans]|uniref:phosphatidate cytidylyltransferase n=1 Tax=Desulfonatronovibrio hydrogenovorans TaxID=53245 RepID=UPI0004901EE6|nr:phosphatidate cytidylyltransferase [Desulfonatronovibrio hydrogenovorans]
MNLTSHHKRILTALLLLPVLGGALYAGGMVKAAVIALLGLLGLWEFYGLFWPGRRRAVLKSLGVFGGTLFILDSGLGWTHNPVLFLVLLFWAIWLVFLVEYSRNKDQAEFRDYIIVIGGLFYVPLVLSLFFNLSGVEIILVLAATFASDTGAYYTGSWLGGKKIWPVISPKKTWSGSFGGLILCLAVCLVTGALFGQGSWKHYLVLGLVLNMAAQLGDFFQSSLKRWNKVKDSGQILPGHGGILDRIDSLLLLLPVYVLFNTIFKIF